MTVARVRKPYMSHGELAYASDFASHTRWCKESGFSELLPIDPALLSAYVDFMTRSSEAGTIEPASRRLSYSTIERRLYGLSACSRDGGFSYYESNGKKIPLSRTKEFLDALDVLRTRLSVKRERKGVLTIAGLEAMIVATYDDDNLSGIRARALLTLQYSAGLKPQQLLELHVTDLDFRNDGVHVRLSDDAVLPKNRRRRVAPYEEGALRDPGYNLREWLAFSGISNGYLFRAINVSKQRTRVDSNLRIRHLSRIYKHYAEVAGLGSNAVSCESPRLGLIVELAAQGADRDTIARRTGLTRGGINHLKPLLGDVVRASSEELWQVTF